ncbi:aldehyde dehydrogenase family protein [Brevibacterium atlanticum]|uniref:aldehyde dehydrogenase family protein n=1 Tax=Brevibacterium atlanticum TaxID=2697563 RepID=UPI00141F3B32|nr:aldehyde dehydrogenase family protein [Brevibacterium atlanticum]
MTVTTEPTIVRGESTSPLVTADEFPPLTHFIDGSFVGGAGEDSASVTTTTIVNPADGTAIAEVAEGTAGDVDSAVVAARRALTAWRATTPKQRADILFAIADRVEENADLLIRLESLNTGKPRVVSEDDISMSADVFRFAAGAGRAFTEMGSGDYVEGHTSVILREPVGVVGVVVPWNYPLLMAAWKIGPILAAGNTLVLKPSEQTPLSTLKFVELIADLLPAGVLNLVTGLGPSVGARLSDHPDIDLVALTGSVPSGQAVATSAGESLKRVHLELGGKAPVIVFDDADLQAAAEGVREAGFWNSGQECGAGTRVLVHSSVAEEFTRLLAEQVSSYVLGDPRGGDDVELGPMISEAHFERVTSFLDRAIADGARPVVGGSAVDDPGFFVAPTVLADVAPGSEASQHEIFGPVVTIETFETEEEALARANEVPYGLAASVWTKDAARSLDAPRHLDFGTVWVNSHLALASEVPRGGFKGSGYGRDLSIYALNDFTRTKHVQINHSR